MPFFLLPFEPYRPSRFVFFFDLLFSREKLGEGTMDVKSALQYLVGKDGEIRDGPDLPGLADPTVQSLTKQLDTLNLKSLVQKVIHRHSISPPTSTSTFAPYFNFNILFQLQNPSSTYRRHVIVATSSSPSLPPPLYYWHPLIVTTLPLS
jgi:hypothetical protein